jgi:dihydroorotate dehydrogenase (NAD+) catalytic subunit
MRIAFALLCCVALSLNALIYDTSASFEDNIIKGPLFDGDIPIFKRAQAASKLLFGHPIGCPIGVAASALMTGQGVKLAARLGFDVLTYKTIRSAACKSHACPNIFYVDSMEQLERADIGTSLHTTKTAPASVALANSFGNGCPEPDWVKQDIACARQSLQEGQILIVSVCGTGCDKKTIIEDFVCAALIAYEAGAHVIELNLSCPNMNCVLFYKDPDLVESIVRAVATSVHIPVTIKVGIFDSYDQMKTTLISAAAAGAKGVCGINAVPIKLMNAYGEPAFGQGREICGLSGHPIKNLAKEFIQMARSIIDQGKLDLVLFATGGITSAADFKEFLDLGADVALCATGFMHDPYVGIKYHELMCDLSQACALG